MTEKFPARALKQWPTKMYFPLDLRTAQQVQELAALFIKRGANLLHDFELHAANIFFSSHCFAALRSTRSQRTLSAQSNFSTQTNSLYVSSSVRETQLKPFGELTTTVLFRSPTKVMCFDEDSVNIKIANRSCLSHFSITT